MASGVEYHALFIVFTDNLSVYRDDSSNKRFFQTTSKRADTGRRLKTKHGCKLSGKNSLVFSRLSQKFKI